MTKALLPLAALLLYVVGCGDSRGPHPGLERFARSPRPPTQFDAPLSVTADLVDPSAQDPIVRFRVTNLSAQPVLIAGGSLPWQDAISVTGIALDGTVHPIAVQTGHLVAETPPDPLAVGASIKGEMPLSHLYAVNGSSRDEDALLLWSYMQSGYQYTGFFHLPKNSLVRPPNNSLERSRDR